MLKKMHKQPLYDQLAEELSQSIRDDFKAGDKLPGERELSEAYGMSRTTVRLALQELERLGLIERRHGRGTFVLDRHNQTANLLESYSITEQIRARGLEPSTVNIEFSEVAADKSLSEHMACELDAKVFMIKRVRYGDGRAMMVERTYVPAALFPTLRRSTLEHRSLYEVMDHDYNQIVSEAEEEFYASIARSGDAHLLDVSEGSPVLELERTTYNLNGEVVEYTVSVARADQFKYRVVHRDMTNL